MIIVINNKDDKFYQYMGKIFGSRSIEKQINDRIYDDDKKEWYLYIKDNKVEAFVSVQNKIMKNIYCYKEEYLEEVLNYIKKEGKIRNSILTKKYIEIYEKCGFQIIDKEKYKNFVIINDNKKVS